MSDQPGQPTTRDEVIRRLEELREEYRRAIFFGKSLLPDDKDVPLLDAALAALRGEVWQPIETAPKGADVILLYCPAEGVMPGYWDDPDWVSVETQSLSSGRMLATHWMPLPAPPSPERSTP
jgi:hypothetical protein